MARISLIKRENKRLKLTKKFFLKRKSLRKIINDLNSSMRAKELAQKKIQKLPRDSSKSRLRNRCWKTGRSRGVYRFVGLCRNMFRYHAMRGDIPGIRKASW